MKLQEVIQQTFADELVVMDGKHFIRCVFGNGCILSYEATAPFGITYCTLAPGIEVSLSAQARSLIRELCSQGVDPDVALQQVCLGVDPATVRA